MLEPAILRSDPDRAAPRIALSPITPRPALGSSSLSGRLLVLLLSFGVGSALASDWPQFRYDARRSAASPDPLPPSPALLWTRVFPPPRPAWPNERVRLGFDVSYEPVVAGKLIYVPSMVDDSLSAFDTDTGALRWKFFADGPVRMAPVAWRDRVFFVSDDSRLYALDALSGRMVWRIDGLGAEARNRLVLGNQRLISLWPCRSGPVLDGGVLFFTAGIWPFSGVFIHAVDPASGKKIWSNSESGLIRAALDDHSRSPSPMGDAGLSPQGYLTIKDGKLIVPSGRAMVGILEAPTGKLLPYRTAWGARQGLVKGSWYASAAGPFFVYSGDVWTWPDMRRVQIDPGNEKKLKSFRNMVLTDEVLYGASPAPERGADAEIVAQGFSGEYLKDGTQPAGQPPVLKELWRVSANHKVHIKAGPRLYLGSENSVASLDLPQGEAPPRLSWKAAIQGTPHRMLAADNKLFVVTREGGLFAFGAAAAPAQPAKTWPRAPLPATVQDDWTGKVRSLLALIQDREGYAVLPVAGSGRLIEELITQTGLHLVVLEKDQDRVRRMREQFALRGQYGSRVAILPGDLSSLAMPPYLASLIVAEESPKTPFAADLKEWERIYRLLRPYGGTACCMSLGTMTSGPELQAGLPEARVVEKDGWRLVQRPGPLPKAGDWGHGQADSGNTGVSREARVRLPLEILWFGGSLDQAFPDWSYTYTRGLPPLVAGGRLFFAVGNQLNAGDVFTGRSLWQADLPVLKRNQQLAQQTDVGGKSFRFYQKQYKHSIVATKDAVFIAGEDDLWKLDPATGRKVADWKLPQALTVANSRRREELKISGDRIFLATNRGLVCLDPIDGKTHWVYPTQVPLQNLAAGGGKVFLLCASAAERGSSVGRPLLLGLDARDGKKMWENELPDLPAKSPTGTVAWSVLHYGEERDVLLLLDEDGLLAWEGRSGRPLWVRSRDKRELHIPPLLHPDWVITHHGFLDPLTGKDVPRKWAVPFPLTALCTKPWASTHLITGRNPQAYCVDLQDLRPYVFRGLRSGCTNSLIPADGVLNAPNYPCGCSCNFPIFTSTAFVHGPEVTGP